MAAQGAFGTYFYDRSILRPKHRAYYRSGRPVIKIGPKSALGSHEIRPIHSAPSLGQSIEGSTVKDAIDVAGSKKTIPPVPYSIVHRSCKGVRSKWPKGPNVQKKYICSRSSTLISIEFINIINSRSQ